MPRVEESIEVDAPVETVYDIWSNFEEFPRFMEHIKEVRSTGGDTTHWRMEAMGRTFEWDATTTEMQENSRVSWRASGQPGNSGSVTFEPLGAKRTRVNVDMEYDLESGAQESTAEALNLPENVVEDDLERFRQLAEERAG